MTNSLSADVEELLASLPSVLLIPAGRLSVEESDAIVRLYAKALDCEPPTDEQLAAERDARAKAPDPRGEQPPPPRPGSKGLAEARRRFGTPTATTGAGQ
jgi:hypothetical protein